MQTHRTDGIEYEIRLMEPADREGYLDLYRTVLGDAGRAWFDWKYADNPYTDHLSIAVATADGEVVGAKSQVGYEVARGTERRVALQPADTMVHPDHRRRGVFSRLTEHVKAHYADRSPALFFNYPNEKTLAGARKHGWAVVGPVTTLHRVQNPARFALGDADRFGGAVEGLGRAAARGYHAVRRRGLDVPDDVAIRRHGTVPVEPLARLYGRAPPDRLHVVRDETYLGWRFGNPAWDYGAYTATRAGEPVAGAVVGRRRLDEATQVSLTEVLPPAAAAADEGALAALLEAVVADHREADFLSAAADPFPDGLLGRFGFLADTGPPLSAVASPSVLVSYPLDEAFAGERTPAARDDWVLGLGDRDTW